MTCSALKIFYRNILRNGESAISDNNVGDNTCTQSPAEPLVDNSDKTQFHEARGSPKVVFVHLDGKKEVLAERLKTRKGHFMPPDMLTSQLETLERLSESEEGITVNIEDSPEDIVDLVQKKLQLS